MSLFRREVIEAQRRRLWGDVRLSQPPSLAMWSLALGGTALAIFLALGFGTYLRKETVVGYLSPEGGIVQLTATRAGRITRVLVREGERVAQDAPLLEFSAEYAGDIAGAHTGQVLAAQISQVEQQIEGAEARRRAAEMNLQSEQRRLRERLDSQITRQRLLASRIGHQEQMVAMSETQAARFAELAGHGYVSPIQLHERRQQLLAQRGELAALQGEAAAVQGGIEELRSQILELPAKLDSLAASARLETSTLRQKLIELSASRRYVERAPVAGVVSSLQAQPGQIPLPNAPLVSLMPEGSALLAELLVPTRAAGFIRAGDDVRLQIEAYPYERFGFVLGQVSSVSRSVLRPGEFSVPVEIREAVYRVRVTLGRDFIIAYGREVTLRPGMLLRADIVIDRRPLWRQFVDPMLAAARRAQ